jgi:3-oxoacyl-[acyl-carrier protein] reductase/meso-butanediol dehydrogenase/(S,S)-butanediol dehydrogenase/diacetyl reductase
VAITGGTKGIGKAIARAFWRNGDYVLIGARSEAAVLREFNSRARFYKTDVRSESDLHNLVASALDWKKRLDIFINCAGYSGWRPIETVDQDFLGDMIDTNVKGVLLGCKAAARVLKRGGTIINVSSLAGKRGSAHNSVYCASKFAVNGITQALAKELGPRGIRINAVCPVYVKTEGLREALADKFSPARGQEIDAFLKKFARDNAALERLPSGDEVGQACVFLASLQASAITGQCINVDCGVMVQ